MDRARLRARAAGLGARLGGPAGGRPRRAARLAGAPPLAPARGARARARPAAHAAVLGRGGGLPRRLRGRWRSSSPSRPTSGTPRSRWTWRSSTRPTARDTFPPHDPWLAGAELNYYYLGQLAMGILVKLTAVAPDHGYNLSLAALFALTAAAVFTIAGTLWGAAGRDRGAVRAGLAAVGLVVVAGNLEGARLLIADGGPLRDYDWFAASRVFPDTITEFPWFSFLLGDLHAHVLALPFTLLALAFALQVVLAGPRLSAARLARGRRRRAGDRVPLRRELVVVPGDGGPAGAGGRGLAARPAERGRAAGGGPLGADRAGRRRPARAAVPPLVRPGRARPRRGGGRARVRGLGEGRAARVRHAARARRGRLRWAGCSPPRGRCATASGSSPPRCSPARCWRRSAGRTRSCSPRS